MISKSNNRHLQVEVPPEIHRMARIKAIETNKSIQEILDELIRLWLEGKIELTEETRTEK